MRDSGGTHPLFAKHAQPAVELWPGPHGICPGVAIVGRSSAAGNLKPYFLPQPAPLQSCRSRVCCFRLLRPWTPSARAGPADLISAQSAAAASSGWTWSGHAAARAALSVSDGPRVTVGQGGQEVPSSGDSLGGDPGVSPRHPLWGVWGTPFGTSIEIFGCHKGISGHTNPGSVCLLGDSRSA